MKSLEELASRRETDGIPVFWTGGIDSTFRVMELLFRYECAVQPIYVADEERRSVQTELRVIERIVNHLHGNYAGKSARLRPVIVINRGDIIVPDAYAQSHKRLRERVPVAKQYMWLSSLVKQTAYDHVEIAMQRHEVMRISPLIKHHMETTDYPCGAAKTIMVPWAYTDEFERALDYFQNFAFPVSDLNTEMMIAIARDHGFLPILHLAWTCLVPFRGEPCGVCKACRHAMEDGKGEFFPASARKRYRYRKVLGPIWITTRNPLGAMQKVVRVASRPIRTLLRQV